MPEQITKYPDLAQEGEPFVVTVTMVAPNFRTSIGARSHRNRKFQAKLGVLSQR
ncbi:MAG: hypothetical protein ACREYF_18185 [Gammaproteobacteria bacterium]